MTQEKIQRQAFGLLGGYAIQFLAGMLLNLFVTIPATHPGNTGNEYFARSSHSLVWALSGHGGWELTVHVYVAALLVLGSISLLMNAILLHAKRWIICSALAALFTIGAFFNGLSFVDFNRDFSSMIMATCWLGAVIALVVGSIGRSAPKSKPASKR